MLSFAVSCRGWVCLLGLLFSLCPFLSAAIISGTVKDPSGALVPAATVEISGNGQAPAVLTSDSHGAFASADLPPGAYQIRVRREGFEELRQAIQLGSTSAVLVLKLQALTRTRQEINVSGNPGAYVNSDPVYRALRANALGKSFVLKENAKLVYDAGSFTFRRGVITFLEPVKGHVTGAVFVGDAEFTLNALRPIDKAELMRRTDTDPFQEEFTRAVFRFTNGSSALFLELTSGEAERPREAQSALSQWEDKVRRRREQARSMLESVLTSDAIDNVDADVLASIYNPKHPAFFGVYIRGEKHKDLRFLVRSRGGAIPQLDSPEEVALLNVAPESLNDGIWYLAHWNEEYQRGIASSLEERRIFAAKRFKIETVIGRNDHLTSVERIDLEPLIPGERVLKFHLLPNLRVSRVTDGKGKELFYIQEPPNADGSFYVIFPEPCTLGKTYQLTIEYAGDRVIRNAGDGSFYIGARECWYATPNSFGEHSLYDLTFRVPKRYTVISVGTLESASIDDEMAVTHWVTPRPVAIAGFNYGDYKRTELRDDRTHTTFEGYYLPELPDYLRRVDAAQSIAPGAMIKYALAVSRAEVQLCNYYFGPDGFDRLYITEQPDFSFGQSWPNLVYLPLSAYMDPTQRYLLLRKISNGLSAFVDTVTPHEVAHQWWGHAVTWASYHDEWLSEGFAEFSAGLFVQQGRGPNHEDDYKQFWERQRKEILEKQRFGASPNDAGPLWLGVRLESPKNELGYMYMAYTKGAYVLSMLRSLMWTEDGDKQFIDMMHDFVASHRDQPASTESFKAVVEKHMLKSMDFDHNGRLDWFFNEWVYGTEIPKYSFTYQLTPLPNGHAKAKLTLTQSEVGPQFAMAVPLFADLGKGHPVRIGEFPIVGSTTKTAEIELPKIPKSLEINSYREILQR